MLLHVLADCDAGHFWRPCCCVGQPQVPWCGLLAVTLSCCSWVELPSWLPIPRCMSTHPRYFHDSTANLHAKGLGWNHCIGQWYVAPPTCGMVLVVDVGLVPCRILFLCFKAYQLCAFAKGFYRISIPHSPTATISTNCFQIPLWCM